MIGKLLNNRYRLEALIGQGGMGEIYRAHDQLLERDVAIKIIARSGLGTEGRARLLNEARAAAKLNHPNIVSIFDAGEAEGTPFIVMELIEGMSLDNLRPTDINEILAIAQQICLALDHAHASGIVHRDLKPENVLIQPNGVAKLTDFGMARSLSSRLTEQGIISGTVYYIAPEMALGQPIDGRVDLYALGVMMYELVAGRLPFLADTPLAVISQHIHAPVIPPSAYRVDLSKPVEAVILKLLAKAPADRYASAQATFQALADAEKGDLLDVEPAAYPIINLLLERLGRGRLIGRRGELEMLHRLWRSSLDNQAHLALVSGEPGVGKTRLANELIVYARLSGAIVLHGGCYEYEAATPFLPFVEALREWVHNQTPEELQSRPGVLSAEIARLAPEIENRVGPLPVSPTLSPNEERLRLFDHVARLFQSLATDKGLLLFIDDIHWADQGSLSLLHYLLRNLKSERLMVIACYREVELDRQLPFAASLVDWNRERLASRIMLGRLEVDEVRQMLSSLFDQENISQEFVDAIFRETEGNPFFIEEGIKSLIEQGQIYRENGHWARKEISELAIPQSVKEAIGRRLDRQSQACIEMLRTAAALGKHFSFSDLAISTEIGENELLDALDEAGQAQLIRPETDEEFVFTHDKIREVLYEELNPIRRRRFHTRIGEGLERKYGIDKGAQTNWLEESCECEIQVLAHHFIEAGDLEKGMRYSEIAARKARKVYALEEAVNDYQKAIECAEGLGNQGDLANLYEALGVVHNDRGSFIDSIRASEQALKYAEERGQRAHIRMNIGICCAQTGDELGRRHLEMAFEELEGIDHPLDLARLNTLLGRFHHLHAEQAQAIEHLEKARELAEPLDDAGVLTDIYAYLSGAYQQWGRMDESIFWAKRCIELGDRKNVPLASALGYEFLAEDALANEQFRDVLEYAEQDRLIGEKIGSLSRVAWAKYSISQAYHAMGQLQEALEAANESLKIIERTGEERLAALVRSGRGPLLANMGDFESAWEDVAFVDERAKASGHEQVLTWKYNALINTLLNEGRWDEVIAASEQVFQKFGYRYPIHEISALIFLDRRREVEQLVAAERIENKLRRPGSSIWNIYLLALINAYQGNWTDAENDFEVALKGFEECGGLLGVGHTLYQRASYYRDRSRGVDALSDARRALEIFEKCGAKPMAQRSKELIEAIGLL